MSGQLVGEVIDAAEDLVLLGLRRPGFMALIAIAEKCHGETRQGSVRWDHIRGGMFNVCLNTARAAVAELRRLELVAVIKPGHGNRHGIFAPVYRINENLGAPTASGNSRKLDAPTVTGASSFLDAPKTSSRRTKNGSRRTNVDVSISGDASLDGIDGLIDGGAPRHPHKPIEPQRYCERHPQGTTDRCGGCGDARKAHASWEAEATARRRAAGDVRSQAIAECLHCDEAGWLLGSDGSVDDRNIRCAHQGEQ
ncbi:MAG: hypothetical protein ACOYB7_14360 [Mycobacterium sp.]